MEKRDPVSFFACPKLNIHYFLSPQDCIYIVDEKPLMIHMLYKCFDSSVSTPPPPFIAAFFDLILSLLYSLTNLRTFYKFIKTGSKNFQSACSMALSITETSYSYWNFEPNPTECILVPRHNIPLLFSPSTRIANTFQNCVTP